MSTPTDSPTPSAPTPPAPAPVKKKSRDAIIATLCGLAVLVFLVYGIATMANRQKPATSNTLAGKVVGKKFTPQPEDVVSFGSRGTSAEHVAGEYVLEVHVKQENRTFEVPVDAKTYEAVRVGASFSFMRPRSEQLKVDKKSP